jgi:predicted Zn-dependent protease
MQLCLFCCGEPLAGTPPVTGSPRLGDKLLAGGYSKGDEFETDIFAMALVRTAGGDPSAGEQFLEGLAETDLRSHGCRPRKKLLRQTHSAAR